MVHKSRSASSAAPVAIKLRYAATAGGLHSTTLRTVNMPRRDNPPLPKSAATDPPTGFGVNGTRRALAWNA